MLKEFREFILRGNVVDLAVAVVVGTAFTAVVTSTVANLLTPLITAIAGEPRFGNLKFTINGSEFLYGAWLNSVITFLSTAAVVFFFVVKPLNMFYARRKEQEPEPAAPAEDVRLLTEIRDLLAAQASDTPSRPT
jgi:large conductance mechanosensitive channel